VRLLPTRVRSNTFARGSSCSKGDWADHGHAAGFRWPGSSRSATDGLAAQRLAARSRRRGPLPLPWVGDLPGELLPLGLDELIGRDGVSASCKGPAWSSWRLTWGAAGSPLFWFGADQSSHLALIFLALWPASSPLPSKGSPPAPWCGPWGRQGRFPGFCRPSLLAAAFSLVR